MWVNSRNPNFREFSTPPPPPHPNKTWISSQPSPPLQIFPNKQSPKTPKSDSFHALHKVPTGDSPYVKAKHVQLIDKDPSKAISLFWNAINAGDRVDSAVKDMAIVMKQLDRTDEAIEAIRSFRHLCTPQSQESLDNVLIDLYKRGGRMREHIQLLEHKVRLIEEGVAFGGRTTKLARSQGKKLHVSLEQEKSRLLGNLAWAYMQESNYGIAEEVYRKALSIEPDKNKQCNLAICLMYRRKIVEAKSLLQAVTPSSEEREMEDPFIKSFDRAYEMLIEIEKNPALNLHDYRRKPVKKLSFSQQIDDGVEPTGCYKRGWTGERRLEEGVDHQMSQYLNASEDREKETCSRSLFGGGCDSSGLDNVVLKPKSEECGATKNNNSFVAPFYRSPNFKRGDSTYDLQFSANEEASRPWHYGENVKQAMFTPTKSRADRDWRKIFRDNDRDMQQERTSEPKSAKSPEYPGTVITGKGSQEEHDAKDAVAGNSPSMQQGFFPFKTGKSWADMVEEEELLRECTNATMSTFKYTYPETPVTFETPCKSIETGNSENIDPNTVAITPGCPMSLAAETQRDYHTQDIQRMHKLVDLEEEQAKSLENNSQRGLSYEKSDSAKFFRPSPLRRKTLFEDDTSAVPMGRRLQVFQDITLHDRPRV